MQTAVRECRQAERPDLCREEWLLFGDFYKSFRFSQGNSGLQESLFLLQIDYYATAFDLDVKNNLVSRLGKIRDELGRLSMPQEHKEGYGHYGLFAEWYDFADPFRGHVLNVDYDVPSILASVTSTMVRRDKKYQREPRPSRLPHSDPHHSYVRTHAVLGRPTGSRTYDHIFRSVNARINASRNTNDELDLSVRKLARAWGRNHTGEKFFPSPQPAT